jgi:predicted acetylornithine/succinylornithine family transaminase
VGKSNAQRIKELSDTYLMNTYGERKIALVRGLGSKVWDADGVEYLDFFTGISVNSLGHCHPAVVDAVQRQAATLMHVSNLYYTEPQARLAALLAEHCFAKKWFFCNSGAEANETAIKLVRRYWHEKGEGKSEFITMEGSFHGRTILTVTATGQPKYRKGFQPLAPGFTYVAFNDIEALEKAITGKTAAVMLEPIQGEGGVNVPSPGYLERVRALCDAQNALLVFDEVQTGLGRTGRLFGYEHFNVAPDVITIAKSLAGGLPMGAAGASEEVAAGFVPGSHASTFGGNPVAAAAAEAYLKALLADGVLEGASGLGELFMSNLTDIAAKHPSIKEVRGMGLMIGVELDFPASELVDRFLKERIIVGSAGQSVLRFYPSLVVAEEDMERVTDTFDRLLKEREDG